MRAKIGPGRLLLALLAVLLLPVAVTQILPGATRHYDGVSLDQVEYSEASFRNETQAIDLAGMLLVPDGDGPFPAAVIIHGSGTSRRDNRWYLTLAKYLQDNGIAVLLPDKRGSEQSGGNWRTASFEDLATDTHAAIDFMQQQGDVPVSRLGIIGMSQGGWIAPIVVQERADLAFVVSVVGSAVTPNEQLLYEENYNIRELGFLPGISYGLALASSRYLRTVRMKDFYAAVGSFDPVPLWGAVSLPTLVLYGREDTNVPSAESAARLEALGNDAIEVVVFPGSGHALQDPPDRGNDLIRHESLEAIRDHILEFD